MKKVILFTILSIGITFFSSSGVVDVNFAHDNPNYLLVNNEEPEPSRESNNDVWKQISSLT
ncbi:hypothetical protein [Sporosarcina sp. UB5]|uniref:hypothetical protein n=1 Tax=Sporosarcina sp. UB5 TaxID=3047463 RepID=UPI003D7A0A15